MKTLYESVQDKESLSSLLYIIYNLGICDNEKGIDRSDDFTPEFMNIQMSEFDQYLKNDFKPDSDDEKIVI